MARKHNGSLRALRQLFRRRNIIIMCEKSVEHYPLDAKWQLALVALVVGGISWISYSTGSYMAAQSVLKQKEQQIMSSTLTNKRMGEEYTLLKQDLMKLQENNGKLSDYAKFIIQQHTGNDQAELAETFALAALDPSATKDDGRLMERVSFLERQIDELESANQNIIDEIKRRTQGKIEELEEVIHLTGLNKQLLQKQAKRELASATVSKKSAEPNFENQGGPFIPENSSELEPELMDDIDQVVMLNAIIEKLPLDMPVKHARITSGFGRRLDPFTKRWAVHAGQDFAAVSNAGVFAPSDGVVTKAGRSGAYGNMVELDHGMGVTTRYGHLSSINVKPGQKIAHGQILGHQGSTGRSTGQHVHYEVRYHNRAIDPRKFLKAGAHVQKTGQEARG